MSGSRRSQGSQGSRGHDAALGLDKDTWGALHQVYPPEPWASAHPHFPIQGMLLLSLLIPRGIQHFQQPPSWRGLLEKRKLSLSSDIVSLCGELDL